MRNLLLLLLFTGGTIFAVSWHAYSKAVEELSVEVVERYADQTRVHLEGFFEPVTKILLTARDWGEHGMLDMEDIEALNRLFIPIIEQTARISSVNIGSSDGAGWLLLEQDDGWFNRVVRAGDQSGLAHLGYLDMQGRLLRTEQKDLDYDPRERPWYKNAAADPGSGEVYWTSPYTFFTTREPGITISSGWQDPASGKTIVIAFDIKLIDISGFTTSLDVSPNGEAVILTQDGNVIGLPRAFETRDQQRASVMKHLDELEIPLLQAAFRRDGNLHQEKGVFSFTSDDWHWWGAIETYPLGEVQQLLISIMVPEKDFLGDVRRQATYMILIFILSLLVAIVMSFVLASRYSRPLQALAQRSRRIRKLDLDTGDEISSHLKEVMRLVRAHDDMTSGLKSFSRYVPVELVKQLLLQGEVAKIGGVTRELSILFTDIRDFTTISERMTPEELTDHLAGYFDLMLRELNQTGATVDKLIGDAIVAFWGAPNEDPDYIRHCIEAVINCMTALRRFNAESEARGLPRFDTCFGLGAGPVVVGNVGSRSRLNYTALGDTMNLTSRLEGLNRIYGTEAIAMESIVHEAGSGYLFRKLDIVAVKGREEPEPIYELVGRAEEVPAGRRDFVQGYESAFALYLQRDFARAKEALESLQGDYPEDLSVTRLYQNCVHCLETPPEPDWDGVTRYAVK
ncbi:MAG: adenylate/guanylate cyclase domain-containing protein [Sedimenticolaceae bacterium]|nr:adenylate/guanylate cyclase domain-containing protein [Sedimenticolaceae bacterium]